MEMRTGKRRRNPAAGGADGHRVVGLRLRGRSSLSERLDCGNSWHPQPCDDFLGLRIATSSISHRHSGQMNHHYGRQRASGSGLDNQRA
jgi:hypothetical protein